MAELLAGFGRAEITPPVGLDLTGFIARENPSDEVLDPLYARAVALEVGDGRLLIVSIDCLGLDIWLRDVLRCRLSVETGVEPHAITLWCTHTHSGPATVALYGCGEQDLDYLCGGFADGVSQAARKASLELVPVRARWGAVDGHQWHEYRRPKDHGPSDEGLVQHQLQALWLDGSDGRALGCLWFYTAHPTILCSKAISADWVGAAARMIEENGSCVAIFGQGCAGDVGPIKEGEPREAIECMGAAVGAAVRALAESAETIAIDRARAATQTVDLPLQAPPSQSWFAEREDELRQQAEQQEPGIGRRITLAMADWAQRYATHQAPTKVKAEVQLMRLGPLVFASLPFEPLSAVGHAIRERLGDRAVVVGFANGCHSYLAPADQYRVGGYEIDEAYRYYNLPSNYEPSAAARVVKAVCGLA